MRFRNHLFENFHMRSVDNSHHQLPCDWWHANDKIIEIFKFQLKGDNIHISWCVQHLFRLRIFKFTRLIDSR